MRDGEMHIKDGPFELRGRPGRLGPTDVVYEIRLHGGPWVAFPSYWQILMAAVVMRNDRRIGDDGMLLRGFQATYDSLGEGLEAAIHAGQRAKRRTRMTPVPLSHMEVSAA